MLGRRFTTSAPRRRAPGPRASAFTLIEVVVVLAIVGIMIVLALPNYQAWVSAQSLRSAVAQLEGDLQFARLTAINRNAPVTVRFAAAGGNRYQIFVDDGSGATAADVRDLERDGTEELLVDRVLDSSVTFAGGAITLAAVDFNGGVAFLLNGRGLRVIPATGNARVRLRNDRGATATLTVTLVGEVNVSRP